MNDKLLFRIINAYMQGVPLDNTLLINSIGRFEAAFHRDNPGAIMHMDYVRNCARKVGLPEDEPREPELEDVLYVAGFYSFKFHEELLKNEANKLITQNAKDRMDGIKAMLERSEERKKSLEAQLDASDALLESSDELQRRVFASMLPLSGFLPGANVRFKDKRYWGDKVYKIIRVEIEASKPSGVGVWISEDVNPFDLYEFVLHKPKWYDFARR